MDNRANLLRFLRHAKGHPTLTRQYVAWLTNQPSARRLDGHSALGKSCHKTNRCLVQAGTSAGRPIGSQPVRTDRRLMRSTRLSTCRRYVATGLREYEIMLVRHQRVKALRHMRRPNRHFFAWVLAWCPSLFALDPLQALGQLHHTSWDAKHGINGTVTALAQTTDGYLWVGTSDGLLRFDGISFERYQPESGSLLATFVTALMAVPDGGLWIGYKTNGASFLRNGRITNYTDSDGFPVRYGESLRSRPHWKYLGRRGRRICTV
jgi:hypothetical protein